LTDKVAKWFYKIICRRSPFLREIGSVSENILRLTSERNLDKNDTLTHNDTLTPELSQGHSPFGPPASCSKSYLWDF
jgi:hypothetical protein